MDIISLLIISFLIGAGIASVLILIFKSRRVHRNKGIVDLKYENELINEDLEDTNKLKAARSDEPRLPNRPGSEAPPRSVSRENSPSVRTTKIGEGHPRSSPEANDSEVITMQSGDKLTTIHESSAPEKGLFAPKQESTEIFEDHLTAPQPYPNIQLSEDERSPEPELIESVLPSANELEGIKDTSSVTRISTDSAYDTDKEPLEAKPNRGSSVPKLLDQLEKWVNKYNLPDPPLLDSWRPLDTKTNQENASETVSRGVRVSESFARELNEFFKSLDDEERKGESLPPDAYYNVALFAFYAGELESAVAYLQMVLDSGMDPTRPLNLLGLVYHLRGFESEAESRLQEAKEAAGPSLFDKGIILTNLGLISTYRRAPDDALLYYAQALEIHRKVENRPEAAETLTRMGRLCRAKRALYEASKYHHEALEIWRSLGNRRNVALELRLLAAVFREKEDYTEARDLSERALTMNRESGDVREEAINLGNIGLICSIEKNWSMALEYFHAGLSLHKQVKNLRGEAGSLGNIGNILFLQGKIEESLKSYSKALKINHQIGYFWGTAVDLGNIGRIQIHTGDSGAAEKSLRESHRLFVKLNATTQAAAIQTILQEMGALKPRKT